MTLRASINTRFGYKVEYVELVVDARTDSTGRFRYIQHAVSVPDQTAFSISKPASSQFGVLDEGVVFSFEKNIFDSVEMFDELERNLVFLRDAGENQAVVDQFLATFSKPVSDAVLSPDSRSILLSKNLFDGFALNDGAEAFDGSTYSFSKGISNIAFVGDAAVISANKAFAESVGAADSGFLSMQDYCDITYFAEDYVGISTTF